jgi:PhnB protein
MKIGFGLYVKHSDQAVALYQEVFGLTLGYHVKNADGTYFHSELYQDGVELLNVIEAPGDTAAGNVVQLAVTLADAAAVEKAFALLSEGGVVKTAITPMPWSPCAGEVVDRFGVWWYLTAPMHHPPADYDPEKPWDASMYTA